MEYWVILNSGKSGTVCGRAEDFGLDTSKGYPHPDDLKAAIARKCRELFPEDPMETAYKLPYPNGTQLWRAPGYTMPALCFGGKECWGRGSCPRRIACSE